MNFFSTAVVLICSLCFSMTAIAQNESDEFLEDFSGDFQDDTLDAVLEEAPAPLEAPYTDAETLQLERQRKKEQARRKKKDRAPLPSVFEESFGGPDVKGSRVRKRYIKHPMAKKGLYKITKEGEYLYKVQKTPQRATVAVRLGIFDAPNLVNSVNGLSFSTLYGGDDPILFFTYEWKLDHWLRNLSFTGGSGLLIASGNGRLESGDQAGQESKEKFTFIMLPNHVGLSYKFRFSDTQKLIPYVEAGPGYYVFNEYRDDGIPPLGRWGGAIVMHAVGGLAFSISDLDRDSSIRLDADYGINGVWLTAEVRQLVGLGTFDMTTTLINAGVMVHF